MDEEETKKMKEYREMQIKLKKQKKMQKKLQEENKQKEDEMLMMAEHVEDKEQAIKELREKIGVS